MKHKLNTVLFSFTGFAEMVWDIGAKIAAADLVATGRQSRCFSRLQHG